METKEDFYTKRVDCIATGSESSASASSIKGKPQSA